jgi:hypothetical protein
MTSKYKVEGNISFYDELFKSLDDETDDECDVCQITSLPLEPNYVTLECNHKFNYCALYKEICRQKYDFKTYEFNMLPRKEQSLIRASKLDYFIKCPYCRNIQFNILPYHEELGLEQKYGINSLDTRLPTYQVNKPLQSSLGIYYGHEDYTFHMYGVSFKKGQCCHESIHYISQVKHKCQSIYVSHISNSELSYCKYHYRSGLKQFKLTEKNKLINEKKTQKELVLSERKKLFDEKNAEREAKGLPPLKRLIIKKKVENIVQPADPIGEYIPDTNDTNDTNTLEVGCKSILKTGPNKGKPCGCKSIKENGLCSRHGKKLEEPVNK